MGFFGLSAGIGVCRVGPFLLLSDLLAIFAGVEAFWVEPMITGVFVSTVGGTDLHIFLEG
jgi:hypothetical protein